MGRFLDTMKARSTVAFWIETTIGMIAGLALGLTLAWPRWIEDLFGVEPDGGSGEAEWAVTAGLLLVVVAMFLAARREWRRSAAVSQ